MILAANYIMLSSSYEIQLKIDLVENFFLKYTGRLFLPPVGLTPSPVLTPETRYLRPFNL